MAPELVDDLVALTAEHVADDPVAVVRVDLVEVDAALDETGVVTAAIAFPSDAAPAGS